MYHSCFYTFYNFINVRLSAPISHDCVTIRSLLEGTIIGAADQSEAKANEALLCKHVCLVDEARVQAAKLAPMHVVPDCPGISLARHPSSLLGYPCEL